MINPINVAMIVDNYFEQSEMADVRQRLQDAGLNVDLISTELDEVTGVEGDIEKADSFTVDKHLNQANTDDYDAVVLPGGAINSDHLRTNQTARQFIADMNENDKLIAAICHAPWALISAGVIDSQTVTSYPSLKDDLNNAGATWVDKEVVVDGNLVTSRNPNDIADFSQAIIDILTDQ